MIAPYPLRFQPLFRDYLWGGRRLQSVLGKDLPPEGIWAESWEVVDHPQHASVLVNGPLAGQSLSQVTADHRQWLFGEANISGPLPLLFKYLDCQRVLSVQVHPDDAYATRMVPPDLGKTEAWLIIDAQPGAVLYAGLKQGVTREDLLQALHQGDVEPCLHAIQPQAGDCVFIPAGTVHALGAGLLVAEIQQASNTTFRLYDWQRVDANGQPRALHVQQSLDVIDFASGPRPLQTPVETGIAGRQRLVACDKFVMDRAVAEDDAQARFALGGDGQMHLLSLPQGAATLSGEFGSEPMASGQTVLLPAALGPITAHLSPGSCLLDIFLPGSSPS